MTAQRQSPDAFEAVVRRAGPGRLAYARRRVDPATAEDVVADALLVLWRRRHELFPTGTGTTGDRHDEIAWAIGITRGCLSNARRSARRHLTLVGRLTRLERPPPHENVMPSERDEQLHVALNSLGKVDQELLRLWAWDDLKPAQIAVVLNTSPEAVSVRLHRAKKRLSAALATPSPRHEPIAVPPPPTSSP